MDFSQVLAGLSILGAVTAIVGAGALMALPDFGRWLTNKVSSFFSDATDDEDDQDETEWRYQPCAGGCGDEFFADQLDERGCCAGCADYSEDY